MSRIPRPRASVRLEEFQHAANAPCRGIRCAPTRSCENGGRARDREAQRPRAYNPPGVRHRKRPSTSPPVCAATTKHGSRLDFQGPLLPQISRLELHANDGSHRDFRTPRTMISCLIASLDAPFHLLARLGLPFRLLRGVPECLHLFRAEGL